jgi:multiple sugar transport system permease protein/N,N'-diacetylchitobiose transport system permease protein
MAINSRHHRTLRQQEIWASIWLVLPSLLIILGVALLPIVITFLLSFTKTKISNPVPHDFVGISNYISFLSNPTFWNTIRRTAYFTFVSVGVELLLGLLLALLIQSHPPGWRFLRISLIIPWAVPTIVNGALWRWIYNADYGALNALLYQLGLIQHYIPFLTRPFLSLNLVVRTVEAFRVFDIVYVITQGGPAFGTVTISYLTYLETFSYGNLGSGSSLSFLISMFTLAMALVYFQLFYRARES